MINLQPPKLYINGFPKSGLHLAQQMIYRMFDPVNPDDNWYGTNPWTVLKFDLDKAIDKISTITPGHYLKGHMGYMPELDELFTLLDVAMVFIYRDLRDVAVSQTYHIMTDDGKTYAPRSQYSHLTTKDEVMLSVIEGKGIFAGVVERWNDYAPWLDMSHVHSIRFEDMVKKPEKVAGDFFDWVYGLALSRDDAYLDKTVRRESIDLMVSEMKKKFERSTFRKGTTAQWKREFTHEHVTAFKATDKDNALYKLGYARKTDW